MSYRRPELRVEETDRGVLYRLPPNVLGWMRGIGVIQIQFGLGMLGFGAFGAFVASQHVREVADWRSSEAWGLCLVILGLLAVGLGIIVNGLWRFLGRDEIVLDERFLGAVMRLGPFRWTRRLRRDRVWRFVVVSSRHGTDTPGAKLVQGEFANLQAVTTRGRPVTLVILHPRELLRTIASDLSRRSAILSLLDVDPSVDGVAKAKVTEVSDDPLDVRDRHERPPGSYALLERTEGGLKIAIPRPRLGQSPLADLLLAVAFVGAFVVLVFGGFGAALLSALHVVETDADSPGWGTVCLLIPFVIFVGGLAVAVSVMAVGAARSRTEIAIRDGRLTIDRWRGIHATHQADEWPLDVVRTIEVDVREAADSDDAKHWYFDLCIALWGGGIAKVIENGDKAELEWMATALRDELGRCGLSGSPGGNGG